MLISNSCLKEIIFDNKNLEYWLKILKINNEKDFIRFYTSIGSGWLNNKLKNNSKSQNYCVSRITEIINSQLVLKQSYNNKVVFRMENNLNANFIQMCNKKTKVINLPYFLSTSKENWKNKTYTIEIITAKNSKSVDLRFFDINNNENEVLFQTNSRFKVLNFIKTESYLKLKELE
jgi:hypothetical protein